MIFETPHSCSCHSNCDTGAIPPLSEFQAQLWIQALLHRIPHPLRQETHYRLLTDSDRRIQYGVDHEAYAYQLALDCGSATIFLDALSYGWKTALVWALGANFNVKFRLTGPWRQSDAAEIMKEELWPTITRRGGFFGEWPSAIDAKSMFILLGLITLSILPISLWGTVSLFMYFLHGVAEMLDVMTGLSVSGRKEKAIIYPLDRGRQENVLNGSAAESKGKE